MQTTVLQPRLRRRQQAAVLPRWWTGRRVRGRLVVRHRAAPLARHAAGHHGTHRGREHTVSADRGTVQPHPGAGAAADYLLVVSAQRARHIYVLVADTGRAGQLVVTKLRTEQPVVLQGPQVAGDCVRGPGVTSR